MSKKTGCNLREESPSSLICAGRHYPTGLTRAPWPPKCQRMSQHPSLSADRIPIEPLRPVETMAAYAPCWCLSGKKYKWCHYRREQQSRVNIFEVESRMQDEFRAGYCSVPATEGDPCSPSITRAHTVQRRGGLGLIADEGHVLTVKPTMKAMIETEGKPGPRRIGVGSASVFPGFCGKHDSALFKPIEGKQLTIDAEAAFLFAYRAVAYERFAKATQMKSVDVQREMDRGHPFWKQAIIQRQLHVLLAGIRVGMRDVDHWKSLYDERLRSGELGDFHFLALRFDTLLPFVAASAFHAEYDLNGVLLQRLGRGAPEFEHMSVNVTAFEGETVLVLGWIGGEDGPAALLARSFLEVPDVRKADALLRLLFVQSDNIYLNPGWWAGLPDNVQQSLTVLIQSGTPAQARTAQDFALAETAWVVADVAEVTQG